jgi:hypothetical protein
MNPSLFIFNLFLNTEVVPETLKGAKVISVFKKETAAYPTIIDP